MKPLRDKKHLAFIRALPCCCTGTNVDIVPHHLLRVPEKCAGRKSGDNWAIPLHWEIHDALHRDGNEKRFLAEYGIDGPALAGALYRITGDYEQAWSVLRELQTAERELARLLGN